MAGAVAVEVRCSPPAGPQFGQNRAHAATTQPQREQSLRRRRECRRHPPPRASGGSSTARAAWTGELPRTRSRIRPPHSDSTRRTSSDSRTECPFYARRDADPGSPAACPTFCWPPPDSDADAALRVATAAGEGGPSLSAAAAPNGDTECQHRIGRVGEWPRPHIAGMVVRVIELATMPLPRIVPPFWRSPANERDLTVAVAASVDHPNAGAVCWSRRVHAHLASVTAAGTPGRY
jgi:hypothetical protein